MLFTILFVGYPVYGMMHTTSMIQNLFQTETYRNVTDSIYRNDDERYAEDAYK